MPKNLANPSLQSKPHYAILDGLRGVAAITVVIFHLFEPHSTSHLDQIINHGYLAVDFFFLLSGFVIGYAYDDRWTKLSFGEFCKRRLIRLQPMVIMGMIIGAIFFYKQDSPVFPLIHTIPIWKVLLLMVIGFTVIPVPPSMDIRGWQEMHPLDGPAWTLFFEYVANLLYALVFRRLPKVALGICVAIAGFALIQYAVTSPNGDVIGGWSLTVHELRVGFTRVSYPFLAGLLLSRTAKLPKLGNSFVWCSLILLVFLAFPRVGDKDHLWANGLYDSLTIIFVFPLIVLLGAGGEVKGKIMSRVCKFFGDISYPIYITHYPLIYCYWAYLYKHPGITIAQAFPWMLATFVGAVVIAYACLKLYDEPIRKWLARKSGNGRPVSPETVGL
jgi:peptidoglycan/LPS O-acetylase OafA/YrhL